MNTAEGDGTVKRQPSDDPGAWYVLVALTKEVPDGKDVYYFRISNFALVHHVAKYGCASIAN